MHPTRRHLLLGSLGSAGLAAIAAAQHHAFDIAKGIAPAGFEFLDPATAADVAAIARQILPSDDGPGAEEAGVIYFIDRALKTFDSDQREAYAAGLADTNKVRGQLFPGSKSIASLSNAQQLELTRAIEKTEFFEVLRIHTVLGFLGNPSYGGNRGEVGWKHISFEDKMAFQPPFGYYDAEAK